MSFSIIPTPPFERGKSCSKCAHTLPGTVSYEQTLSNVPDEAKMVH